MGVTRIWYAHMPTTVHSRSKHHQPAKHAVRAAEQARWLAENEDALDYYNAFVEKHGPFGEEFREF